MTFKTITEEVNLDKYPKPAEEIEILPIREITTGGIYANAAKLLFILIRQHIIYIAPEHYLSLVKIYHTPASVLTLTDFDEFSTLIDTINVIDKKIVPRFLGDELGLDKKDYFILKILEKLSHENSLFETLLSIHGLKLMLNYETEVPQRPLTELTGLVEKKDEVLHLVNCYKKNIKLISYSLNLTEQSITIFCYEAINLDAIPLLAEKFGVEYKGSTCQELAVTIDKINTEFLLVVHGNNLSSLFDPERIIKKHEIISTLTIDNVLDIIIGISSYRKLEQAKIRTSYLINYIFSHSASSPLTIDSADDKPFQTPIYVIISDEIQLRYFKIPVKVIQHPPQLRKLPPIESSEQKQEEVLVYPDPDVVLETMPPEQTMWLDFSWSDLGSFPNQGIVALLKSAPKSTIYYDLSNNGLFLKSEDEELAGLLSSIPKHVTGVDLRGNHLASLPFEELKLALRSLHRGILDVNLSDNDFEKFTAEEKLELFSELPKTMSVTLKEPCITPPPLDAIPITDEHHPPAALAADQQAAFISVFNEAKIILSSATTESENIYTADTGSASSAGVGRERYGMYPTQNEIPNPQCATSKTMTNTRYHPNI